MEETATAIAGNTPEIPAAWKGDAGPEEAFFERLAQAATPVLICDYDGTLAPFTADKMQAFPYPGVAERLEGIAEGRTRLAFVSGRPVEELMRLLPLAARCESWGMHGREHRSADGKIDRLEPSSAQRSALDCAGEAMAGAGFGSLVERKIASVAVHWRGLEEPGGEGKQLEAVQALARRTFAPYAGRDSLSVLPFDGGLELRADDHTKGHATEAILDAAGWGNACAAAFLGDDTTDEDAFRVMRSRGGVGLLVRHPPRASCAHFSLRPPEALLAFLDSWVNSIGGGAA